MHRPISPIVLIGICLYGSADVKAESVPPWIAHGSRGMVASDSKEASAVGVEILKAGGNAFDAAAAVSFALAVTRPYSTGLGGGGFLIGYRPNEKTRFMAIDFRETAPASATGDMFIKAEKQSDMPLPSRYGHLAVGVPGVVAGRFYLLERFGRLPRARVLAPAIRLAREGFPLDQHFVKTARGVLKVVERYPVLKTEAKYVYETYLGTGDAPIAGVVLKQPRLAKLLEGLAKDGPDFFYRGPVAKAIAAQMKACGGILTEKDLADYEIRLREPTRFLYREYEIVAFPPPSSGGVALAEMLNILEIVDMPKTFGRDPGLAMHYQVEAMKHAFADRSRWLGDSDFVGVPALLLSSKPYAAVLAKTLRPDKIRTPRSYGNSNVPDDAGTSHFCVVDQWGNAVTSSETINTSFGSLMAVEEWGLILNNEMDDFMIDPGEPNAYGLVQSKRNGIEPGKRPLSSMSPTLVLKDDEPYLLLGGSGGPRIISSVLRVLLGILDFGESLEAAIEAIRPHHQWLPDKVYFDSEPSGAVRQALLMRGHALAKERLEGTVQAIVKTETGWLGACDPRKGGQPAGY